MQELKVRGRAIRSDENGLICLTDIWDAAGFSVNQKPSDWHALPTTARLMDALSNRIAGLSGNKTKPTIKSMYYSKVGRGGGTFAHPVLACAYAGYLSPKLEVEVREVWLRYRAGDPTLADEVLERASPEANLWVASRAEARAIRNGYTETLRDHDVRGSGFGACTDEAYLKLFGGRARQLRNQRSLPQKANLRDSMDIVELSAIKLTEALATQRITVEDSRGNTECKEATGRSAANVRYAIDLEMKDRQRRLTPPNGAADRN